MYKLLKGEESAHALLSYNPFPDQPPRFIRADLYRYRLVNPYTSKETLWYHRELLGPYIPPLSLDQSGLRFFIDNMGWR